MQEIEQHLKIGRLITLHLSGAIDAAAKTELDAWISSSERNAMLFNSITDEAGLSASLVEMAGTNTETALQQVKNKILTLEEKPEAKQVKLRNRFTSIATVATIAAAVTAIALCIYFFTAPHRPGGPSLTEGSGRYANDIAPGTKGATLTLANGKTIALSGTKKGVIVGNDLKYDDGTLISKEDGAGAVTASTDRGKTYQFTLPDGSKVWLNAASSITFPASFVGNERRVVEISGEAYFEIAKVYTTLRGQKTRQPFIVISRNQEVEVLGTHFNINSYDDEAAVKTTLIEGSVRVAAGRADGNPVTLQPNQQAAVTGNAKISVKQIDAESVVDWKNDEFVFEQESLASILRKVSRWYNVEIVYENEEVKTATFSGSVSRFDKVSKLLRRLDLTDEVHFKIEGRKIIVSSPSAGR